MNKRNIKVALGVTTLSLGSVLFSSAEAIPISYFNAGNTTYISTGSNNVEEKSTIWKSYNEPKIKNVTLESLASVLKNTPVKKDDVIVALGLVTSFLYPATNSVSNDTTQEKAQEKAIDNPVKTSKVPEPTSILLLALGMLGIAGLRSRKV